MQDDPLAAGGGAAWGGAGAGAGGFGSTAGQAAGGGGDEYDVVEITDDQLSAPAASTGTSKNVRSTLASRWLMHSPKDIASAFV